MLPRDTQAKKSETTEDAAGTADKATTINHRSQVTPHTMWGIPGARKGPLAKHEIDGTRGYSMVTHWRGGRPS